MRYGNLADHVHGNITQMDGNHKVINASLALVKQSPWRLIRNRHLLDHAWELVHANQRLGSENSRLIAERWRAIEEMTR